MTTNVIAQLAELFEAAARVLRDPSVMETGTKFLAAIDQATDRELAAPLMRELAERIDAP